MAELLDRLEELDRLEVHAREEVMLSAWEDLPPIPRARSLLGMLEALEAYVSDAQEFRALMEQLQAFVAGWLETGDWPDWPE